jgi:RNA polymerase sigma-70 factor (ECF subfamily)
VSLRVLAVVPRSFPLTSAAGTSIELLFREHYARLVRSLTLASGDAEAAADAVQEAFVRAHGRWSSLRRYDDPVGWIRRVAINLLHDDRRRRERRGRLLTRLAAVSPAVELPPEPDALGAMLEQLPRQQRTAVALYYVEGMSVAEVADAMGIADGSVKSHLHDARRRLRSVLEEHG